MRTFAQKQSQSQKPMSSSLARHHLATQRQTYHDHPLPHLQRNIGNQAVLRLLQTHMEERDVGSTTAASLRLGHDVGRIPIYPPEARMIQTKLTINEPGDSYEQEAERVAEQVMRMPASQTQPGSPRGPEFRRYRDHPEDRGHARLQTMQIGPSGPRLTLAPPIVGEVLQSTGRPLDVAARSFMESRFGRDFSRVRVHTDETAARSATAINAAAYTSGQHVVFGGGRYGLALLAHELAHVGQQASSSHLAGTLQRQDARAASAQGTRTTKQVTLADVAAIVSNEILDYRENLHTAIETYAPPEDHRSTKWFWLALAGNMVWAAACLMPDTAPFAVAAMSFGGSAVASGVLQKAFAGTVTTPNLRGLLLRDVGTYTDNLKLQLPGLVQSIHTDMIGQGLTDANNAAQTLQRRELAWNWIFDGRIAPYGQSSAIISQTHADLRALYRTFDNLFEHQLVDQYGAWWSDPELGIKGPKLRYTGARLYSEVKSLYLTALITSGVAAHNPAISHSRSWRGGETYHFPSGSYVTTTPSGRPYIFALSAADQ